MSKITYGDVEKLCKQLSLNNIIINDTFCGRMLPKGYFMIFEHNNNNNNNLIYDVTTDCLTLYNDGYLDYCNKNNNIIIENFIKNKKIKLILYPNIYKSNIQNFDLISALCIQNCKHFTNIFYSKKIKRICIDSKLNNKNIKGVNLLKKLKVINTNMYGMKLNKNITNQINKLNKYNKIINKKIINTIR